MAMNFEIAKLVKILIFSKLPLAKFQFTFADVNNKNSKI